MLCAFQMFWTPLSEPQVSILFCLLCQPVWRNRTMRNILRTGLLVVAASFILSVCAFAQFEKGTISGVVTDATGALVVGADVKATSASSGAVRTAVTNDSGIYTLSNLPPGTYEI